MVIPPFIGQHFPKQLSSIMSSKTKKVQPVALKDISSGRYWFTPKNLVQNIDSHLLDQNEHGLEDEGVSHDGLDHDQALGPTMDGQDTLMQPFSKRLHDDRYNPNLELHYDPMLTSALNYQHNHTVGVDPWPTTSPYACFNCTECFDHAPVKMPSAFDEKYLIFKNMTGNWCSLSCLRRYIMDRHEYNYKQQLLLISAMALHLYHVEPRLTAPAPPVTCLQKFGGPLSLEQYRSEHLRSTIVPTHIQHVPGAIMYEIMRYNDAQQQDHVTCDNRSDTNMDAYQVPSMGFPKLPEFQVPIKDTLAYQHGVQQCTKQ